MQKSDLHEAALAWAARGVPVFPITPGAKKPPLTPHGWQDATCDPAIIDRWWTDTPNANVAIYPGGAKDELAIVDTDPPAGEETWKALEAEHGSIPTYTVLTPRGGRHRYFRGSLPPTASRLGDKIDTRGRGSYALVAPSVTADGEYSVEDAIPLAALPAWIPATLGAAERGAVTAGDIELDLPSNIERAARFLAHAPIAVEYHGGNDLTYRTACQVLNFGLSHEAALDVMADWNERCEPPWTVEELGRIIYNATQYAQNEAGAWAADDWDKLAATMGLELVRETKPPPPSARFKLWTPAELRALPPLQWLVPEIIPAGAVGMIYAPPDSYKSFLALALAMPIAATRDVVYVAGEGSAQFGKRVDAWCMANGVGRDGHKLTVVRHMPRVDAGKAGEWQDLINAILAADRKPALVIIDTMMQAMVGLEDSSSRDASTFTGQMHAFAEALGCAVLFVHHAGKDVSRGARGSSAIMGDIEFALEVEAAHNVRAAAIHVRRQKDAERRRVPLCFEGFEVAGSLAFAPIDYAVWKTLTTRDDMLAPKRVMVCLTTEPITTHVLATMLRPQEPEEDEGVWQGAMGQVAKALNAAAKTTLAALCEGEGHSRRWSLPKRA